MHTHTYTYTHTHTYTHTQTRLLTYAHTRTRTRTHTRTHTYNCTIMGISMLLHCLSGLHTTVLFVILHAYFVNKSLKV